MSGRLDYAERRRIRQNVLRKSLREQPKDLAIRAFWRALKNSVADHRYRDGFVEWSLVVSEFEELFEKGWNL